MRRAAAREYMQLPRAGKAQKPGDEASGNRRKTEGREEGVEWDGKREVVVDLEKVVVTCTPSVAWRSKAASGPSPRRQ